MTDNEGEQMTQTPAYAEVVASQETDPLHGYDEEYYRLERIWERAGYKMSTPGKRRQGLDPVEPEDAQPTASIPPVEDGIAVNPMEDFYVEAEAEEKYEVTRRRRRHRRNPRRT